MTSSAARVLIVEDVPIDAEMMLFELQRAQLCGESHRVSEREGYEQALREFVPDLILSDYSLPGFDGRSALALRQSLGGAFKVVVADPAFAANARTDLRASAIAAAARRMFETLGVWDAVAAQAQPITEMIVTDSRLKDAVRPVFLSFAGEIEGIGGPDGVASGAEPFAHMIENAPLNAALAAKARAEGIDLRATAVTRFENDGSRIFVSFGDGSMTADAYMKRDR